MPIRKTSQGWFWGSKGPFDTKAKAMAVGRAAYASGYKENVMNSNAVAEFVATLFHSATITHFMHLQATGPGSSARHMALGEYYDSIVELTDTLAENIQGAYGLITEYPTEFRTVTEAPLAYIKKLKSYVDATREELPQDSNIQNDIDAIATLLNSTAYKLEFLS